MIIAWIYILPLVSSKVWLVTGILTIETACFHVNVALKKAASNGTLSKKVLNFKKDEEHN